jgi:4-amino-4-deoxy-L-arabinose transferase-like glycosyltransferase
LLCLRLADADASGSFALVIVAGFAFAAALFCRPNFILLLPVAFVSFWLSRDTSSLVARSARLAVFLVCIGTGFALLGIASHGSVFFPRNGPYNLYAGHNSHTAEALIDHLNAETSLVTSYFENHPSVGPLSQLYAPELGRYYTHQSILFARQHPAEEVKLIFIKLFTLFRPDTKVHGLLTPSGLVKLLLALPAPLFIVALLLPGRSPLTMEDRLLLCIEILYIIPFLLTNSDPRFRIPLDAILLLHLISLVYRRRSLLQTSLRAGTVLTPKQIPL